MENGAGQVKVPIEVRVVRKANAHTHTPNGRRDRRHPFPSLWGRGTPPFDPKRIHSFNTHTCVCACALQGPDFNGQLTLRAWASNPGANFDGKIGAAPDMTVGVSKVRTQCTAHTHVFKNTHSLTHITHTHTHLSPHIGAHRRHRRALQAVARHPRPGLHALPLVHADAPA